LSLTERRSAADTGYLALLMRDLERRGLLDRGIECLPSDSTLLERQKAGRPLTRPELAVLLSYSKIALTDDLLASKVPDEPLLERWLLDYFPTRMRTELTDDLKQHRLRREIIATALTNALVNRGGPALAVRLADETGRSTAEAAQAYLAVRYIFNPPELATRIDALDGKIDGAVQLDMHQSIQDLVQRQTHWFLRNGRALDDLNGTIARHSSGVKELGETLDTLLSPERKARIERLSAHLAGKGVPNDLARDIARLELLALAPEITEIAQETGRSTAQAAKAFFAIGDAFKLAELAAKTATLAPQDYYDRLALAEASNQILAAQHDFTRDVLRANSDQSVPDQSVNVATWIVSKGPRLERARTSLAQIATDGALTVSRLTVAAGQLRDLAG
jgi:glutamate dehydrogenase